MGTPHIGMGRDMSIFQIGESPYQYGAHSNLGTDTYAPTSMVDQFKFISIEAAAAATAARAHF